MFDQILQLVKEHMNNNPQVAEAIPEEQADAVHQEIATHIDNGIKNQVATQGTGGGLLSMLEGGLSSESPVTSAITGGLVGSLASKFGLSPAITGAIAASIPGILQRFMHQSNNANDQGQQTSGGIMNSLESRLGGLL
ncbi:MAG: hypothetical protein H0X33_12890 [Taibaiella sp.]|nr:hypothetical protein [Taibaiella sp.]